MKTQHRKTNTYTFKKYRIMFFNFGLVIALLMTITAFEWEFEGQKVVFSVPEDIDTLYMYAVPNVKIIPPEPPKEIDKPLPPTPDPNIKEVKKPDAKPYQTSRVIDDSDDDDIIPSDIPPETIENPDPLRYPTVKAEPPKGFDQFYEDIQKEVGRAIGDREKYLMNGKNHRILITFIIDINGEVQDVKMERGFTGKVNRAAINSVVNSGIWKPAYSEGKRVPQVFTLPIRIRSKK